MTWIGARYRFASTFSYRLPNFSSSYALSAPAPSPSTIKLAIIATAIRSSGDVEEGRRLFEKIRTAEVTVELPHRIAAFKGFIKRLKAKRQERGFESTFGIREYIVYSDPLGIYIDVAEDVTEKVSRVLRRIQYLGTSDSLCTCLESGIADPPTERCIKPFKERGEGIIFLLTDFTEEVSFENINPYSGSRMREEKHLRRIPYLFPLRITKKESNYTIYETLT